MAKEEYRIFFKRFVKNPKHLGSLIPSSKKLATFIGSVVAKDNLYGQFNKNHVVELGPGTGRFTEELLKLDINLTCVEIDEYLCSFLTKHFNGLDIINGDARYLKKILPESLTGNISTIVSGIPLMNLSKSIRNEIINSCFEVLSADGKLFQFTYNPLPLIPPKGYKCQKIGVVWSNLPPAIFWSFQRDN